MTLRIPLQMSLLALLVTSSPGKIGRFLSSEGRCANEKGETSAEALDDMFELDPDLHFYGMEKMTPLECLKKCFEFFFIKDSACGWNRKTKKCSLFAKPVELGNGSSDDVCWVFLPNDK